MRIAQVIDSLQMGGAQKLLVTLAQVLPDCDVSLLVISLDDKDAAIQRDLESQGVQVFYLPGRKKLFDPWRVWAIARCLRQEHVNVVHTHLTHANILGTLAARLANLPVVASLHNTQLDRRQHSQFKDRLETSTLRLTTGRLVAVGYVVEEAYRQRLPGKCIEVIPNSVRSMPLLSVAERAAVRFELVGDPARPLLIAVGRLTRQKGYHDLLASLALLRQYHPAVALVIAGQGLLYDDLSHHIWTLGLNEHAFLLGQRNDVPRLLAASDIYINASLWEGLSVAILEAMAAGLPVVATAVGEAPRMVAPGTGIVTPPGEPSSLASAIASLLDDPFRRQTMAKAAQGHVACHYNASTWANRLLALYSDLCSPSVEAT